MNQIVENTCKIGQGHACCRYLVAGVGGFECAKQHPLKTHLDARVLAGTINSRGDNCEGYTNSESIKILND